jgi:hypothetical protein
MAALLYCGAGSEKLLAESDAKIMAVNKPHGGPGSYVSPYLTARRESPEKSTSVNGDAEFGITGALNDSVQAMLVNQFPALRQDGALLALAQHPLPQRTEAPVLGVRDVKEVQSTEEGVHILLGFGKHSFHRRSIVMLRVVSLDLLVVFDPGDEILYAVRVWVWMLGRLDQDKIELGVQRCWQVN